jgi:hypothetical protein
MSRHQNARQNHNLQNPNKFFENVAEFMYLETNVTIHGEIKITLNPRNACYYSVQNILSSRIPFKNLKIKIYETIIPPVM